MDTLWSLAGLNVGEDNPGDLPPGSPPTYKFEGPWFTTQLLLSLGIGITSFLVFSYCRTRWPLLFAPRTKLTGFSPHEAHAHQAFFGWILPTIRTSEYTVLQIVGLDAAVLLNFYKMSFYLFSLCSVFAVCILMPINLKSNIAEDGDDWPKFDPGNAPMPAPGKDWLDLISDVTSYLTVQLLFTYLFTILALYFIYKNYRRFIRSRQLFLLEHVHSIPARTVMVTNLPADLRSERALAEYFENMALSVESVSVCREVGGLKKLLDERTKALLALEAAWVKYVGNPSSVEAHDPSDSIIPPLNDTEPGALEGQHARVVVPHRKRPTLRPGWFASRVDALEYLESTFKAADEKVKRSRKNAKFKATHVAFVTFEKMSSAQIAMQTAHASDPYQRITRAAPEPRDIVWANMALTPDNERVRQILVFGCMALLLFSWIFPITALASLLSYKEIKKTMPWLGRLIDSNEQIRAIVQNSLPSVAMVSLNALLPFLLEGLTYVEGLRARSWVEYSLLKKYFLFLLVNVVFIFLLASTYWQLVRDLAESPAKIPEKLAQALQAGRARHFFLSYVVLQGLGVMPLQLLNLGVILPRLLYLTFITRTPRDFAELNAPPLINYGVVYPQSILLFVITLLYSVNYPPIVIFGAIYFGISYVVYKYKLLFVFYKPYESQGQAWPLTFVRLIWGVIIFLLFMIGNFLLNKAFIMATLLSPLLIGTVFWSWRVSQILKPLSKYVSLSSVFEVQRGEDTADVQRLRAGHPVTWSQSNLNRRRYAQNDETLYVAPEDERTDYSQPPMANWYSGVLNTGKRRYGHPALNGLLPEPWLPLKKGQTLVNNDRVGVPRVRRSDDQAVVLTLRKRYSMSPRKRRRSMPVEGSHDLLGLGDSAAAETNPWLDARGQLSRSQTVPSTQQLLHHRLSFDPGSGVIALPEEVDWLGDESDSSDELLENGLNGGGGDGLESAAAAAATESDTGAEDAAGTSAREGSVVASPTKRRYGTYYHHPERRRQPIPGAFPR